MLPVVLLPVLATLLTPKQKPGLEAESVDALVVVVVVVEATAEVAVARPAKRGAAGAVVAVPAVVGLKEKGAGKGIDAGGPRSPKMGLKVGVAVLVVVGRAELEAAAAVTEGLDGMGPSLSLLGGAMKMGLNIGEAGDGAGAAGAGLEGAPLDSPNSTPCLGGVGGAGGPGALADVSVWRTGGDLVSATGAVEEAGTSPKKVAVDFESEEVPGRGPGGEEPREASRLGVFRGDGAVVGATSADSGRDGSGGLCIFFRLSNNGLVPAAGGVAAEEVVPTAGWVKVKEG